MKRMLLILLALTLILAGCASEEAAPPETQVIAEVTETMEGPKIITHVDDFLAAIAPGAEILLGEGTFTLSDASDYGQSQNPNYVWSSLGNGEFELQLQDVEGLTIRGCGKDKTSILTAPRTANVLTLRGCQNLILEDVTMGHIDRAEACEGGVVNLDRCSDVQLTRLGLFGCGSLGMQSFSSSGVTMLDCAVYDCSIGGVYLFQSQNIDITSTAFYSLGKEEPVSYVFGVLDCEDVEVSNCMISNNYVGNLLWCDGPATFRSNSFTKNRIVESAFSLWTGNTVLADNVFEENTLRNWYASNSLPAVDMAGAPITFEDPNAAVDIQPAEAVPVATGEQKEVRVKTVDQFLAAIAPDTCILLEGELLDFSKATGYGTGKGEYYRWVDNYDGPGLVISGVTNFTIKAEGDDRTAHTLSAVPRYADVLTFENCAAITLSGFTAGHTVERGSCTGGVILLQNCEDILIENCGLYGCGTEGVHGEMSKNIQIINSEIYECSICGIELGHCENVTIAGTIIRDIGDEYGPGNFFRFYNNKNVTFNGQPLDGNYHGS